jgi:hypothetical protein
MGTTTYASLNSHLGMEQSRRDDLESLAYVLIYFFCGSLPWHGAKTSTKKQRQMVTQMKADAIPDLLRGSPNEFSTLLEYARALQFEDKPNYIYIRKIFDDLCVREGHQLDSVFDWCLAGMNLDNQSCLDRSHLTPPGSDARVSKKMLSKKNDREGTQYPKRVFVHYSYPSSVFGSNPDLDRLRSHNRHQHSFGFPTS